MEHTAYEEPAMTTSQRLQALGLERGLELLELALWRAPIG
jgi:hypothetical protein